MSRWARTRSASLTNELDNDDVLRRLRVLVVGDASAGKSTLLHRLEHGVEPSRSLAPTVGCNVVVIEVEGADADVEADEEWRQQHSMQPADRPYVELLDIGGSKEYATARPVFYTDRDLDAVIIVYDVADAAGQTTYATAHPEEPWLNELQSHFSWAVDTFRRDSADLEGGAGFGGGGGNYGSDLGSLRGGPSVASPPSTPPLGPGSGTREGGYHWIRRPEGEVPLMIVANKVDLIPPELTMPLGRSIGSGSGDLRRVQSAAQLYESHGVTNPQVLSRKDVDYMSVADPHFEPGRFHEFFRFALDHKRSSLTYAPSFSLGQSSPHYSSTAGGAGFGVGGGVDGDVGEGGGDAGAYAGDAGAYAGAYAGAHLYRPGDTSYMDRTAAHYAGSHSASMHEAHVAIRRGSGRQDGAAAAAAARGDEPRADGADGGQASSAAAPLGGAAARPTPAGVLAGGVAAARGVMGASPLRASKAKDG